MKHFIHVEDGWYNYENPMSSKMDLQNAADSLSRLPRFLGHYRNFSTHYSVADHSSILYLAAKEKGKSPEFCRYLLCHDLHESVLGDIGRPLRWWLSVQQGGHYITRAIKDVEDRADEFFNKFIPFLSISDKEKREALLWDARITHDENSVMLQSSIPWVDINHLKPLGVEERIKECELWTTAHRCTRFLDLLEYEEDLNGA